MFYRADARNQCSVPFFLCSKVQIVQYLQSSAVSPPPSPTPRISVPAPSSTVRQSQIDLYLINASFQDPCHVTLAVYTRSLKVKSFQKTLPIYISNQPLYCCVGRDWPTSQTVQSHSDQSLFRDLFMKSYLTFSILPMTALSQRLQWKTTDQTADSMPLQCYFLSTFPCGLSCALYTANLYEINVKCDTMV